MFGIGRQPQWWINYRIAISNILSRERSHSTGRDCLIGAEI
jgi:hypothetical protein